MIAAASPVCLLIKRVDCDWARDRDEQALRMRVLSGDADQVQAPSE